MDRQEITEKLKGMLAIVNEDLAQRDDVTEQTDLRDGLGMDSLQVVELLFEVEEQLGVKIEDEEAKALRAISDLLDLIEVKLPKKLEG